jgi:HSP20 family protein
MFSDIFTGIEKHKKFHNGNEILVKVKPVVDIYETENSIVILTEMPGVRKEDLRVSVKDGILTISGQRQIDNIDGEYLMRESNDVVYERAFELEDNLDQDKIDASYSGGILKVKISKKEETKPRQIDIN